MPAIRTEGDENDGPGWPRNASGSTVGLRIEDTHGAIAAPDRKSSAIRAERAHETTASGGERTDL